MTEDEKTVDFMVEIAWKGIEGTQAAIDILENKAINLITFSGVILTIIGGISLNFLVGINLNLVLSFIRLIFILSSVFLLICVHYSFKVIKLRKQEVLNIIEISENIDFKDIIPAKGEFIVGIAGWQKRSLEIADTKSKDLSVSMFFFEIALVGIFLIVIYVFFSSIKY